MPIAILKPSASVKESVSEKKAYFIDLLILDLLRPIMPKMLLVRKTRMMKTRKMLSKEPHAVRYSGLPSL